MGRRLCEEEGCSNRDLDGTGCCAPWRQTLQAQGGSARQRDVLQLYVMETQTVRCSSLVRTCALTTLQSG